ncbi:MAG: recombinase family protein [Pseudomonadales bacterium]
MMIGYARVSTTDQKLETQIDQLEVYGCERIFSEKLSGKSADARQELLTALSFVRAGDVLVVTKLDRLARSAVDLGRIVEQLEAQNVDLVVLNQNIDTSTSTGKLMFTMIGAFAEFERDLIRERCAEGIVKAKEKGVQFGRRPKLSEDKIRQLRDDYQSGELSRAELARKYGISRATLYRLAVS